MWFPIIRDRINTIIIVIMAVIIQVNSRALDFLPIFSLLRINIDVIRVTTPKMYGKYRASTIEVLNNIVVKLIGSLLYRESLIYIYISVIE